MYLLNVFFSQVFIFIYFFYTYKKDLYNTKDNIIILKIKSYYKLYSKITINYIVQ